MLNNKGQNSIIKWYQYQMVEPTAEEEAADGELPMEADFVERVEGEGIGDTQEGPTGGKFEGLEGKGDMLDERVAQIMAQYTGAKQNNVDDIINNLNQ